nr:hypothetical protein [Oscillatoria sp. PCC 10802]
MAAAIESSLTPLPRQRQGGWGVGFPPAPDGIPTGTLLPDSRIQLSAATQKYQPHGHNDPVNHHRRPKRAGVQIRHTAGNPQKRCGE